MNFAAAGSYQISFSAAQRANYGTSNEEVEVLVDGTVVDTFTPASTIYTTYTTASFNVTAGSHTITFVGVDPSGTDYTALLDQTEIYQVVIRPPALQRLFASPSSFCTKAREAPACHCSRIRKGAGSSFPYRTRWASIPSRDSKPRLRRVVKKNNETTQG